jgi:hypothetical protein
MAFYNRKFLKKTKFLQSSEHEHFIKPHGPGSRVGVAGIYRCDSCGFEVLRQPLETLPETFFCGHHDLGAWFPPKPAGKVRWHLAIAVENRIAVA